MQSPRTPAFRRKKESVAPSAVTPPESGSSGANPDEASIAVLAYQLWLARGCPIGSDQDDWYLAESILKSRGEEEPPVSE
jgi:hypothetical protein